MRHASQATSHKLPDMLTFLRNVPQVVLSESCSRSCTELRGLERLYLVIYRSRVSTYAPGVETQKLGHSIGYFLMTGGLWFVKLKYFFDNRTLVTAAL